MGRPRTRPLPEFPQVLVRNAKPEILGMRAFDAGNLHGRVTPEGYEVRSYDDVIARYFDEDDEWHVYVVMECSKTTRWHLSVVQNAINSQLYSA